MLEQELRSLWTSLLKDWDMQESDLQVLDNDDYQKFVRASSFRCAFQEKVNKKYKIELDVVTFFEDDFSIENLARIIEKETLESSTNKKAEVDNKNPPFFLFPSIVGDGPDEYRNLIAEFKKRGMEHPIYPFKAPGLINSSDAKLNTQQLIDHYFQLLKRIQPNGPYYLGGWSSGAFIAYGVAQTLRENNDEVRYLALIDEVAPPLSPDNYDPNIFASDLLELIKHLPANLTQKITYQELAQKPCKEQIEYVFTRLTPMQSIQTKAENTLAVVKGFLLGLLQHQFKPTKDLGLYVFYTDKTLANNQEKQHLNWDQYGKVVSVRVGENHFSPINQPAALVMNIISQIKKDPEDHINNNVARYKGYIDGAMFQIFAQDIPYHLPLTLNMLDTLLNCYAMSIFSITLDDKELKKNLDNYRNNDLNFWGNINVIAKEISTDMQHSSEDNENAGAKWVKDICEKSSSYTSRQNSAGIFYLNGNESISTLRSRAQNWSTKIRAELMYDKYKPSLILVPNYDSDDESSKPRDTSMPAQEQMAVDFLAKTNCMFIDFNHAHPLAAFKTLCDVTVHFMQRILSASNKNSKTNTSQETNNNNNSSNSDSAETTDALIQAHNRVIQESIALSLNSPCSALTVLQLLQKFMGWYAFFTLDILGCCKQEIRSTYRHNEIIFNAAILSIIKDLKGKALTNSSVPYWINEWLISVESFARKQLTTISDVELLDHTLTFKKFLYGNHNETLENLSNPDSNFVKTLIKTEDSIMKIKKISDKILFDSPKQHGQLIPLYTTLVTQANFFASNIRKKEAADFIYKPDDFNCTMKI